MYLIRDRDGAYGHAYRRHLRAMEIRDRPTAPRSPWAHGSDPAVAAMIAMPSMAGCSSSDSAPWAYAIIRPRRNRPGKTRTLNGLSARSGGSALTDSWSPAKHSCAGSFDATPTTTIAHGHIDHCQRTVRCIALLRRSERSRQRPYSAAPITSTLGRDFRDRQEGKQRQDSR